MNSLWLLYLNYLLGLLLILKWLLNLLLLRSNYWNAYNHVGLSIRTNSLNHYWLRSLLLVYSLILLLAGHVLNVLSVNNWLLELLHLVWINNNWNLLLLLLLLLLWELDWLLLLVIYLSHLYLLWVLITNIIVPHHLEMSSSLSSAASNEGNTHYDENNYSQCHQNAGYWISKSSMVVFSIRVFIFFFFFIFISIISTLHSIFVISVSFSVVIFLERATFVTLILRPVIVVIWWCKIEVRIIREIEINVMRRISWHCERNRRCNRNCEILESWM